MAGVLLLAAGPVAAQELTVTCNAPNNCDTDTADPLFPASDLWYPEKTVTKTFRVINNTGEQQLVTATAENSAQTGDLDTVLLIQIIRLSDTVTMFDGTLRDFYQLTSLNLGAFNNGTQDDYSVTVTLPDVGNEFQGVETSFDLVLSFNTEDVIPEELGLLRVTKANNVGGGTRQPGNTVQYVLKVTVGDSPLTNVEVVDLPPEGFQYRNGSWEASSNIRGDLRKQNIVKEPKYSSPGVWKIGSAQPNEVITLKYIAKISSGQDEGIYRDLAIASAETPNGTEVIGNQTINNPDPFVGSEVAVTERIAGQTVRVVQRTENENGDVLGASTGASSGRTLPKTGIDGLSVAGALLLLVLGTLLLLRTQLGALVKRVSGKTLMMLLFGIGLLIVPLVVPQSAYAADLSVRIERPKSPTNQSDFPITFVVLDRLGRAISATCLVKKPGSGEFVPFNSTYAIRPGGNSDSCLVTSSTMSASGTYQFMVQANAGGDVDISEIVVVDYSDVPGPGTPTAYSKQKVGGCQYQIKFKTANDSGRTNRVEVYRSSNRTFTANTDTRVKQQAAGSNQDFAIFDTPPNCDRTYYYAVRAFDQFNNGSGIVADREVVVTAGSTGGTTGTGTGTAGTGGGAGTGTAGGGQVAGAQTAPGTSPDATDEGEVQGAEDEATGEGEIDEDVLGNVTESIRNFQLPNNGYIVMGLSALLLGLIFVGYVYFAKKNSRKR